MRESAHLKNHRSARQPKSAQILTETRSVPEAQKSAKKRPIFGREFFGRKVDNFELKFSILHISHVKHWHKTPQRKAAFFSRKIAAFVRKSYCECFANTGPPAPATTDGGKKFGTLSASFFSRKSAHFNSIFDTIYRRHVFNEINASAGTAAYFAQNSQLNFRFLTQHLVPHEGILNNQE